MRDLADMREDLRQQQETIRALVSRIETLESFVVMFSQETAEPTLEEKYQAHRREREERLNAMARIKHAQGVS